MTQRATWMAPLLLAMATACGVQSPSGHVEESNPQVPKSLTILQPPGYDHRVLLPPAKWPAMHLLYSPLFEPGEDGEVAGSLIESWEHSADGREWTYHLRPEARWHDGVPVTAADVVFTDKLRRTYIEGAFGPPPGRTLEVLDELTYRATYTGPGTDPLDDYSVLLPAHLLADVADVDPSGAAAEEQIRSDIWSWDYWERPIGNGPFRFVRRAPNRMVELEANPDHFAGRPKIDRLIVKLAENPLAELRAGNVDIVGSYPSSLSLATIPALEADPDFEVYWQVIPSQDCLLLNHRHPALGDRQVRRALALAIDGTIEQSLQGVPAEAPYFDVPVTTRQLRQDAYPEALPHDPTAARSLLAEAGWIDRDGDGIREQGDNRLSFTALAYTYNDSLHVLEFVQSELRKIGVEIDIVPLQHRALGSRLQAGDFDAIGLQPAGLDILRFWNRLLGESPVREGPTGYRNSELTRLVGELRAALLPERRDAVARQMWPIFQREVPVIFLGPRVFFTGASKRVRGLKSPQRTFTWSMMADVWIETESN